MDVIPDGIKKSGRLRFLGKANGFSCLSGTEEGMEGLTKMRRRPTVAAVG